MYLLYIFSHTSTYFSIFWDKIWWNTLQKTGIRDQLVFSTHQTSLFRTEFTFLFLKRCHVCAKIRTYGGQIYDSIWVHRDSFGVYFDVLSLVSIFWWYIIVINSFSSCLLFGFFCICNISSLNMTNAFQRNILTWRMHCDVCNISSLNMTNFSSMVGFTALVLKAFSWGLFG